MSDDTTKKLQDRLDGKVHHRGMVIVKAPTIKVSVKELKDVIEKASKSCPIAQSFTKGISKFPDNYVLAVEKLDLEACMSGGQVEISDEINEDGSVVQVKSLKKAAAKPSKKKPTEDK